MNICFSTFISVFILSAIQPLVYAAHIDDSTRLTGLEKKQVIELAQSLARAIKESEQITYRWQSKAAGESLIKDEIQGKLVFEKKGQVGNNQELGSGFYVSSNFWDSSGYAPDSDSSLVQVIIPADKKVLDLTQPETLAQLQRAGVSVQDIARFDPELIIKYKGHAANSHWFCIKDIQGVRVEPFDGRRFSTQDLLNFKVAIENPSAEKTYLTRLSEIIDSRKRSSQSSCEDPFLPEQAIKEQLKHLGNFYEWNEFGECILHQSKTEFTVIVPRESCIAHIQSTQVIRFRQHCYHYNSFGVLTHTVPLQDCPAQAEQAPHPQVFDPKANYKRYSRLIPLADLDSAVQPSKELTRATPPDEMEIKLLEKNHLLEKQSGNPPSSRYQVLYRTDKGFKSESFSTRKEAQDLLKTIPDPIDLERFLTFKLRVAEPFKKDLEEALAPLMSSAIQLKFKTSEEIKNELFNHLSSAPLSHDQYFNILNQPLMGLDLSFESEAQVNQALMAIKNQFKSLDQKGFFELNVLPQRDAEGNYFARIKGHIRGTPFEMILRTLHAEYESEHGTKISQILTQALASSGRNLFHPEKMIQSLHQHYAQAIMRDPRLKFFLEIKLKEALTPMIEREIEKIIKPSFLSRSWKEKSDEEIIESLLKKTKSASPDTQHLVSAAGKTALASIKKQKVISFIRKHQKQGQSKETIQSELSQHPFFAHFTPTQEILKEEFEKAQLGDQLKRNLGAQVQTVIATFYQSPLPKTSEVQVVDAHGKSVLWSELNQTEKRAILKLNHSASGTANETVFASHPIPELETKIPRWIHGPEHIARVALEIEIIAQLYREQDPQLNLTDSDIILAQYLSAFHDSARQSEGIDLWGDQSAENAREYLKNLGVSPALIERCVLDLKQKDLTESDPNFSKRSLISQLIHDADSLDRLRVSGKRAFDIRYLNLYQTYKSKKLEKKLKQLVSDFDQFIEQTEERSQKLAFKEQVKQTGPKKDSQDHKTYLDLMTSLAYDKKSPIKKWMK